MGAVGGGCGWGLWVGAVGGHVWRWACQGCSAAHRTRLVDCACLPPPPPHTPIPTPSTHPFTPHPHTHPHTHPHPIHTPIHTHSHPFTPHPNPIHAPIHTPSTHPSTPPFTPPPYTHPHPIHTPIHTTPLPGSWVQLCVHRWVRPRGGVPQGLLRPQQAQRVLPGWVQHHLGPALPPKQPQGAQCAGEGGGMVFGLLCCL